MQNKDFSEQLKFYRRQTTDPNKGGFLSQDRMADLVDEKDSNLSISRNVISDLETGKKRVKPEDMDLYIAIIQVLYECGSIEMLEQANQFLQAGNLRGLKKEEAQKISSSWNRNKLSNIVRGGTIPRLKELPSFWPPSIPDDPYYQLPGHEQKLDVLLNHLRSEENSSIIFIDGLGGQGKTAIGVELVRRALNEQLFAGLVGDSAKQETLSGGEIVQVRKAKLDFNSLLDTIARQLKQWEIVVLSEEEKYNALTYFFGENHYLIFVDNLETSENANLIVSRLRRFLNGSRAIVTSRNRVHNDFVLNLTLKGLDKKDSLQYIKTEAQEHNVEQVLNTREDKLRQIIEICGGAPLAMKLVVAQAKYLDLDVVLRNLSSAGTELYPFIYRQSWEQLSITAQKILIYIGKTVVTTVSWEELDGIGITEDQTELVGAIDQLVSYSLVTPSLVNNKFRYGIHQLTRQFVNSDLPNIWREQGIL